MSNIEKVISECFEEALLKIPFVDKEIFYSIFEKEYNINANEIANNYEVVHQVLRDIFGARHFVVERAMVRILHDKSKQGIYAEDEEIPAFMKIVESYFEESTGLMVQYRAQLVLAELAVENAKRKLRKTEGGKAKEE